MDFSSNQKSYLDEINPSLSAVKYVGILMVDPITQSNVYSEFFICRLDDGVKLKQGYALRDIRLLPVRERIKALLINGMYGLWKLFTC